ncbi:hypothetical protein M6D93_06765 [Jatrophihabitans telluris]|uniref:DUF4265 domain-containing protein n=1 Tax=Jatrophihabitans telluris TaxID=2038343 RepID=A0ABY4R2Y9_9ACTN|nr:hypothetical protein [Jatrophihabitans telluris]UQX89697.1 hypothetical protein M6D93_06765 [Jatrophihabitans telluris]
MRVYVPVTSSILQRLAEQGVLGPAPITAFAVTPGLREWYVDDDLEELEYAASSEAARACLRLLSADDEASRRRIVIAADIAEDRVEVRDELDRGVVAVQVPISLSDCASIHADDDDAEEAVDTAVRNIDAADLGDPEAEFLVDEADGFELSWYATQELSLVLEDMS